MKIVLLSATMLLFGLSVFAGGGTLNPLPKSGGSQTGTASTGSGGISQSDYTNPTKAICAATAEFKLVLEDGQFLEVYGTARVAVYSMGKFVSCNYRVTGGLTNILGLYDVQDLKMYNDRNVTASIRSKVNELYAYFSGGPRLIIDEKGQYAQILGGHLGLSDRALDAAYGPKGLVNSRNFQSAKSDATVVVSVIDLGADKD